MSDGRRFPRVEDLVLPRILQLIGEADTPQRAFAVDEGSATIPLHPLMRAMLSKEAGPAVTFGIMARTSVLFVVDYDEYAGAVSSAAAAPLLPELPPLPYPRVSVECAENAVWPMGSPESGEILWELEMFTINEETQGEEWHVHLLVREYDPVLGTSAQQALWLFAVSSDGSVTTLGGDRDRLDAIGLPDISTVRSETELRRHAERIERAGGLGGLVETRIEPDDPRAVSLRSIPVEFAHLVNARGVSVDEIPLARAQRRRFERSRLVHPKVYFVVIGEASSDEREGRSDREYHCRWLVRGHWRRYENGSKTWVRPYIKGPAGAPWKGRPIYIGAAALEPA